MPIRELTLDPAAEQTAPALDGAHAHVEGDGHSGWERIRPWVAFLQAHSAVTRRLEAELSSEHALALGEYDVLLQLARAPHGRLRMHELAERVLLSRSGISRLVDRMEAQGLLCREACSSDRRGAFAVLTRDGASRLRDATPLHLAGVRRHFLAALDDDDRQRLAEILERVTALTT